MSSTSPRCSDFMRRMTPASEERSSSGSVCAGRFWKSSSAYRRMQTPLMMRPQRPARWLAAERAMSSTCSISTLLRWE
jgi:hypothetical protein